MRWLQLGIVSTAILVLAAGNPHTADPLVHTLLVPIGRYAVVGVNEYAVFVDGVPADPGLQSDGLGGYWTSVRYDPSTDSQVTVRFITTGASPGADATSMQHDWLAPSRYIDADDEQLVRAALDATGPYVSVLDRTAALQAFVAETLDFRVYEGHPLAAASETYRLGYGTCVNHARLFVALSRAAGIPARTVWGIVHSDGVYDYHHEWAEVCDEHGRWHQLDPVYAAAFDLESAEYLDLVYAPEENPLNPYDVATTVLAETDHIAYDTSDVPCDGRLGFVLVERNRLGRFVIENTYPCPGAAN
jgi:transglutaminase-like putative cysteine protease